MKLSQPYPRCSKSWPSTINQKLSKQGELFREFPPYLLRSKRSFHNLIYGVQRPTPWNKSEFFKIWRAVSKNPFLLSAELNGLFTTSFHNLLTNNLNHTMICTLILGGERMGKPIEQALNECLFFSVKKLDRMLNKMADEAFKKTGLAPTYGSVSYTHLRAHETDSYLVCRLLLEKKNKHKKKKKHETNSYIKKKHKKSYIKVLNQAKTQHTWEN